MAFRAIKNLDFLEKSSFLQKNHTFLHFFLKKFWKFKNFAYLCTRNRELVDSSKG